MKKVNLNYLWVLEKETSMKCCVAKYVCLWTMDGEGIDRWTLSHGALREICVRMQSGEGRLLVNLAVCSLATLCVCVRVCVFVCVPICYLPHDSIIVQKWSFFSLSLYCHVDCICTFVLTCLSVQFVLY